MAILWEIPFCVLFLIVLSIWFTDDYYVYYENMRNEKEKKNPFQQSEVSTHHSHTSIILMNQTKEWNPL